MGMRFVDLELRDIFFGRYLDLPPANHRRIRINTFLTEEFSLRSQFFIFYHELYRAPTTSLTQSRTIQQQ